MATLAILGRCAGRAADLVDHPRTTVGGDPQGSTNCRKCAPPVNGASRLCNIPQMEHKIVQDGITFDDVLMIPRYS